MTSHPVVCVMHMIAPLNGKRDNPAPSPIKRSFLMTLLWPLTNFHCSKYEAFCTEWKEVVLQCKDRGITSSMYAIGPSFPVILQLHVGFLFA